MEVNNLREEIYGILSDLLKIETQKINDESLLIDEYNLDSVRLLSLIMILETKFNITLNDEEISVDSFKTPLSLINFIKDMIDGKVTVI
jgi:acyl carrier protein